MAEAVRLTKQQERVLKFVYKFRFVTKPLLAQVLEIRKDSTYEALEKLVKLELLVKVYEQAWRIDRKPAYYCLSKTGVTTVRKLLDIKESHINSLYRDHEASTLFINESLATLACYAPLKAALPAGTIIRSKTEINRFKIFPKHRPDLFIQTPDSKEAFIIIVPDKLPYFVNKRLDEYIEHSEEEGWEGSYPTIAFVVRDNKSKMGFLFKTNKKLEGMGMDEKELSILATGIDQLMSSKSKVWGSAFHPLKPTPLF